MLNERFCHLHCHGEFSLLDGLGKAEQYVAKAKELGFKYLALTDHGNIDGLIKFQRACEGQGVTPILGAEIYIVERTAVKDKGEVRWHATLLVKNRQGWSTLCAILTQANVEGFYYRPRIGVDDLLKYDMSGLVMMTGCAQSFIRSGEMGQKLFSHWYREWEGNLYIEIMPHNIKIQKEHSKAVFEIKKRYPNANIVATNDCHYIEKGDWLTQEVLLAIQRKAKWGDEDRFKFGFKGLHLRTADEMVAAFKGQGIYPRAIWLEALRNTVKVAKMCQFTIPKQKVSLPEVPRWRGRNANKVLFNLIRSSLYAKGQEGLIPDPEKYKERAMEEYALIKEKGFSNYFLIVKDLLNFCLEEEILYGPGRGSVGGSMVAYLIGITNIDPIKFGLIFDRFINRDRVDMPDIDLDFEDRYRERIRQYLKDTYGERHISGLSTFLQMKSRSVIRDVGRVFQVPNKDLDEFAKSMWSKDKHEKVLGAYRDTPEGGKFNKSYPKVYAIAEKLEHQTRGAGQHPAAIIVSGKDLTATDQCNLCIRKGVTVANWDMEDAEYVGLMKLDILGLATLTIIRATLDLIKEDVVLERIPLNDFNVFSEISRSQTGLFQITGGATSEVIRDFGQILSLNDLADIISLSRPGPLDSGTTAEYCKRKHGGRWAKKNRVYERITADTYGMIVYQEQIMQVVHEVAGLPYSTADKIRKVIGKKRDKKEFDPYWEMFLEGCIKQGAMTEQEAKEFWQMVEFHAGYSFNRSHAIAYAMIGYWTAYFKTYHPTEFICASLTHGKEDTKVPLIEEAHRKGLKVYPPKLGLSDPLTWVAKGDKLYVPFVEVKGIGEKTAIQLGVKDTKPSNQLGFFDKEEEAKAGGAKVKINSKVQGILSAIGAYDPNSTPQGLGEYFSFNISDNPKINYPILSSIVKVVTPEAHRLEGVDIRGLIKAEEGYVNRRLLQCESCNLVNECKAPVLPSPGRSNVAIIGEAPGPDEDRVGEGFVGRSGDILWGALDEWDYERGDFHVTNANKCYPSKSKRPSKRQIKLCKPWLKQEMDMIGCRLALCLGKSVRWALTGDDSSILAVSGVTEWVEEWGLWACWCVHPSYVLRQGGECKEFEDGIENFVTKIEMLRG